MKPFPILQIINLVMGIMMMAWEWPLSFIAGSSIHRSLEARLAILPMAALAAVLTYQGTNAALYYLVAMIVEFWAYSEGEVCSSSFPKRESCTVMNQFADLLSRSSAPSHGHYPSGMVALRLVKLCFDAARTMFTNSTGKRQIDDSHLYQPCLARTMASIPPGCTRVLHNDAASQQTTWTLTDISIPHLLYRRARKPRLIIYLRLFHTNASTLRISCFAEATI